MMKSILISAVFFCSAVSFASTNLTVVTTDGNSTTTKNFTTKQKTLRSKILRNMVQTTAANAMSLDWDEGARTHKSFTKGAEDQFHITEMRVVNGVVRYMAVTVNGLFSSFEGGAEDTLSYSCTVDLERYAMGDDLISEYALCETEHGEEIEYEN